MRGGLRFTEELQQQDSPPVCREGIRRCGSSGTGMLGAEESLSTCEMAHWAAAMAVLATEAALMRLPSLEAMSLGRMSETGSEMRGPKQGGRLGGDTRGALTS